MATHRSFLVAAHLILLKEDQVLLCRRYQTGFEDGKYHLPAGHLEWGETIRQAMVREAKEELGISFIDGQLQPAFVMHRQSRPDDIRIDYFFTAQAWQGEVANQEPAKCDDVRWFPISALPEQMVEYARFAVQNLSSQVWYLEYGW